MKISRDISFHNGAFIIPVPKLFKVNEQHKFYLFYFNAKYDEFIGMDFLQQSYVVIDIGRKLLITHFVSIPFIFDDNQSLKRKFLNCNYWLKIPPRIEQVVEIAVSYGKHTGVLDYINFGSNLESPKAQNYFAIT